MIVANPIYDVVFKALLENLRIARGFLSALIGMEILELRLDSQEHWRKDEQTGKLRGLRLDFCAVIKTGDGRTIQVIIELQKAKLGTNPMRFRYYLASRYLVSEEVHEQDQTLIKPLPIISIYLLGYYLDRALPMAVKVNREYCNAVTGKPVKRGRPNDFIENLTHDALFVQIPKIKGKTGTEMERVLSIFDQSRKVKGDNHRLEIDAKLAEADPLLGQMCRVLNQLNQDPEMEKLMKLEDIFLLEQQEEAARVRKEMTEQLKKEQQRRQKAEKRSEKELKRREEADQRREEADQRREEADQRREEEQKLREESDQRREEAEEEVARLRKLLDEKET